MSLYLDSSALVKFVITERESAALRAHVAAVAAPLWTSRLAATEVGIAAARWGAAAASRMDASHPGELRLPSATARTLPVTGDVLQAATDIGAAQGVRTLDAIHIATAAALGSGLVEVVTYDSRMASACRDLGLRVTVPGGDLRPEP